MKQIQQCTKLFRLCLRFGAVDLQYNGDHVAFSEVHEPSGLIGRHCIYELQGGNPLLLDDEDFITTALKKAAKAAGATLLNLVVHKFEPQGVTALALLAESHISIHSWPEHGYAAIDAFTCGAHTDPVAACRSLHDALEGQNFAVTTLSRKNGAINRVRSLDAAVR